MKIIELIFEEIYQAMIAPDTKLSETELIITHTLFTSRRGQYGFDIGKATDIDTWLKIVIPSENIKLTPASQAMFNSLFNLYHANTHLMLLRDLIRENPDFGMHYKIIKISNSPEIFDLCNLKADEPREDITAEDIADYCARNQRKAMAFVVNNGIPLPINVILGTIWPAAVELLKKQQPDFNLDHAIEIVNKTAKENLKNHEIEQTSITAYKNMIVICRQLFSHVLLTDNNNVSFFNYKFKSGASKNIDSWLSTHSPFNTHVEKTILEPTVKETLNGLFKLNSANKNLKLLQSLIESEPDFCNQFKIIQVSDEPDIFDITQKSAAEIKMSKPITVKTIEKYNQRNYLSARTLMNAPSIVLPKEQNDYLLPLDTPKKFNFEYNEMTAEKAKQAIIVAAAENSKMVSDVSISITIMKDNGDQKISPPRRE